MENNRPGMKCRREFVVAGLSMAAAASSLTLGASCAHAQDKENPPSSSEKVKQELIRLSREKWSWMTERKVDSLAALFHDEVVFVHMGATMTKKQELDTIRGGGIQYKSVDIQDASVRVIGTTAILLNRIRLVAVVGGNEVTNPFVVTEVYVRENNSWMLASLSFTRTLG